MEYVIVGATGFLGSYFVRNILDRGHNVIATYNSTKPEESHKNLKWIYLDITDFNLVDQFFKQINPVKNKNIIFLSAYHHPDKVEKNPNLAWHINITSLSYFLSKIDEAESFYYASSDSVYGESSDNYMFSEGDNCNPTNIYGRQKLLAERLTLARDFNVVRYSFLIGKSIITKPHFYNHICSCASKDGIELLDDSYRNPISFDKASKYTIDLIERGLSSSFDVVNIGSDKAMSKYEVGQIIAQKENLDDSKIIPISFAKFGDFGKSRAKSTIINSSRLKDLLNLTEIKYEA